MAMPNDGDAVYQWLNEGHELPRTLANWAVKNGVLAYSFYGSDGMYPAFYCPECAEKHIRTDVYLRCRYPRVEAEVLFESVICDDCFTDLSN